ncbi:MAG: hypothetical protein KC994_02960, partial [Candidatus Omnitrophica bacterium]|nr:hypothetical protein [Candidatus Omnitrophota bacterium]
SITYADGTPILECEKIVMPHDSDSSLIFTITAHHPAGYLRSYHLNCFWGNNRYGGLFTSDQYEGSHDVPPPLWDGVLHHTLPPLLPMIGGSVEPWYTCAYHFHLEGTARITDGVHYLKWSEDNVYQSVDAGVPPITPEPTPTDTPVFTPTFTPTNTPTTTPTPTPTDTTKLGDFAYMVAHFPIEPVLVAIHPLLTEDLSVHGIEITQGIQCFNTGAGLATCPDNSMPMVTNKTTTARIYMRYSHSLLPVGTRDNVPVKMYLRWNGGIWVSTIATGKARSTVDQSQAANSANVDFYVSTGLNSGTLDYYVVVDPNDVIDETNESNNRYPATGFFSIDFFKREKSDSVGRLLRYHPSGYTGPQYAGGFPINWCVSGGASDWRNLIMPIADNGIDYSIHSGYLDWTDSLASGDGQHLLIEHLNTMWVLENYFSFWFAGEFTGAEHVYGWVPYSTSNWGHADMPAYPHAGGLGVVAIGTDETGISLDDPGPGALIYGHELTHTFDVFHTNTGADDCGANDSNTDFPYATSSIQEFGYNPLTGKVYNPSNTHDLMSYCPAGGSKEGWIAPFTWNKMFNKLSVAKVSPKVLKSTEVASPYVLYKTNGAQSLMVNATVYNPDYQSGQILGELGPLYRGDIGNTLVLPEGDYAIELLEGTNVLARHSFVVSFKSQFSDQPDLSRMDVSMIVPWVSGTTTVALLHLDEVLDQRDQSPNAPTVTITDPSAAANWPADSTQTLTWTGEDLDGDTLSYSVFFSHNGGASWELLKMEYEATSYEVAVDSVAGGTDTRFRVVATDGINVGFDETDAPIAIPNKEPIALIANPKDGDHFSPGGLILFQGSGTDLEDGALPGSSLEWSSDLQGALGSGNILPATGLDPGLHVITLTVTDSNGQTGEAHVFITINSEEMLLVDQNSDGLVNHEDLIEILSHWDESLEKGYPPSKADLNADGVVNDNDLFDFGRFYRVGE